MPSCNRRLQTEVTLSSSLTLSRLSTDGYRLHVCALHLPSFILLSRPELCVVKSIQHDEGCFSFACSFAASLSVSESSAAEIDDAVVVGVSIAEKGRLLGTAFSASETDCVGLMRFCTGV